MAVPRVRLFQFFNLYNLFDKIFKDASSFGSFFDMKAVCFGKVDDFAKLKGRGKLVYLKSALGLNLRLEQRIKTFY